ncbi:type IV toxin-antitoxin system AbiEi family antitoxin domain-containing protein [Marinoscillum sp.]|uniref:type IV toxin-antitoxin system AbiEi family antitoxin domain-containing protein n=1 Tax=Marinoscillum sp. TaxID=2024838 RepID=UPI003BADB207
MPRRSSIDIAKDQIKSFFTENVGRVISTNELYNIIWAHSDQWGIASSLHHEKIASQLVAKGIIKLIELEHDSKGSKKLYAPYDWKDDPLEIGAHLTRGVYFTHYTAMAIHGLTDQIPKSYFINYERPTPSVRGEVDQDIIDKNFSKPLKRSSNIYSYHDFKFYLLQGVHTGHLGVQDFGVDFKFSCTNLERTLIDITVRPTYSGGVTEVLEAFIRARESIDINQLLSYLKRIQYAYPYHQAIGFYMECAGYSKSHLELLKKMGINYKFYLSHGIRTPKLSSEWNIIYPNGF